VWGLKPVAGLWAEYREVFVAYLTYLHAEVNGKMRVLANKATFLLVHSGFSAGFVNLSLRSGRHKWQVVTSG